MSWAGVVLGAVAIAFAVLSWNAGGQQPLREMSQPVAVPELPR
jgi:hypothetical protein